MVLLGLLALLLQSGIVSDVDFRFIVGALLAIVALLFLACVALCVIYLMIARRLTRQMQKTVRRMETLLDATLDSHKASHFEGVPPFRINVQDVAFEEFPAKETALVAAIDGRLRELSFSSAGDYQIEETGELLRAFISDDEQMLAAIRLPRNDRVYAEFCMDIGDGRRAGVGNPPIGSLVPDDTSIAKHFSGDLQENPSLLSQMWLEAKEMTDVLECQRVDARRVPEFFEQSHASEMDWRMTHGGVTEEEIRQAFAQQGGGVSDQEIELVQLNWQKAIDDHILSRVRGAGPASRLLVVHEYSLGAHLENRLAECSALYACDSTVKSAAAETSLESCRALLATMLKLFPPRDAIARLRPHLPDNSRYQLLHTTTHPIAADIYRFPVA